MALDKCLCDVNIVAEPCALKSPMSAERLLYIISHIATINNENPMSLFSNDEDSGVVKNFLKKVRNAAHRATDGSQIIVENRISAIFAQKPAPKIVPKLPNKTIS